MEEYPVMSTSQGTYVPIEQTSEAIRVTYEICRGGVVSISFVFIVIQKEKGHV